MKCKNCDHAARYNYCENCGQKTNTEQLSYKYIISELNESLFSLNKGLFFTFKELTIRPGRSIREFLEGKRRDHYKPISYLIVLSSIYFVLTSLFKQETWLESLISGIISGYSEASDSSEIPIAINWFAQNYAYTTLILLPLFAFLTKLLFAKYKYNFIEHLALNSYIAGHQSMIYTFFAAFNIFLETDITDILSFLSSLAYCTWVLMIFFKSGTNAENIIRTIGVYILYLMFSLLLLFLIIGINEIT